MKVLVEIFRMIGLKLVPYNEKSFGSSNVVNYVEFQILKLFQIQSTLALDGKLNGDLLSQETRVVAHHYRHASCGLV